MTQALPVPAFSDNYIWLIPIPGESPRTRGAAPVAIVDPGDATPVMMALQDMRLRPAAILITHHHFDHTGGVPELIARYPVPVYGPAGGATRGIDRPLREGDVVTLGDRLVFRVLTIPGHTLDHIAYYGHGMVLCGDTLFTGGCGRLFEGSAPQMYQSLKKLAALPDETQVYCGHEYTLSNLEFARHVEPGNVAIQSRITAATRLRRDNRPTVPSTLDEERRTNPFLRCAEPAVIDAAQRFAGATLKKEHEVFSVIRRWKDSF